MKAIVGIFKLRRELDQAVQQLRDAGMPPGQLSILYRGGADQVEVRVPGLPEKGTFQCASWAGDGSHRIPMMERANQTPAFDAVRVQVK